MMPTIRLPSREDVLEHGIPAGLSDQLYRQAREARARAVGAAIGTAVRALRRAWGEALVHAPSLKVKAL